MTGIREEKKRATRDAIKASSVQLFTEKGFDQTSIEDIANAAGIGKTTIYGYFSNKNEIINEFCLDEFISMFSTYKPESFLEQPLIDNLLNFFMVQFNLIIRNPEFGRQLMREFAFPLTRSEKSKEQDQHYFALLDDFFQIAAEKGEIKKDYDMILLSHHFYSLYLGVIASWYTGYVASQNEAESKLRAMFKQVLEGVA